MIILFILFCVAIMVIDEAKEKHCDLKKMINELKEE